MIIRKASSAATQLAVEYLPPLSITPNPKNARRHSDKQLTKLRAGIDAHGFNVPIVIDQGGMILAGHARHQAALQLKLEQVPCVRLTHLNPAQKIAFAIADNKLGDLSAFHGDALKAQLAELAEVSFNMELTGFDTAEIDMMFDGVTVTASSDPDDVFDEPASNLIAVSQVGDLWQLDKHWLLCGNALKPEAYERLLGADRAQLVFTDPPYNVPVQGHVSGLGRAKHREFAMASGEMTGAEFESFLASVLNLLAKFSGDGSIHFVCMDWRHIADLIAAGDQAYSELKNICVWNKTNAGMGSLYRSKHEFVAVFKNGTAPHQNNVELGKHGRHRSNIWDYAGANTFGATRDADLAAHPTVKPVALVADAIRDCSKRGGLVLDPFVGSGTTILAAERTGRRAAAMELDPLYVDTAIARWQRRTGKAAVLAGDRRTFHEVRAARAVNAVDDASSTAQVEG